VAENLHEAPARWIADLGMPALRALPDARYTLTTDQKIRLRDHAKAYAEHAAAWQSSPQRGVALAHARQRDEVSGFEVPRLRAVPEIGPGS